MPHVQHVLVLFTGGRQHCPAEGVVDGALAVAKVAGNVGTACAQFAHCGRYYAQAALF
ncbi:MAG: hypothetical protein OXE94_07400 [Aestuariivita sp.]|nr:hypothetical protein [Aestuariivita sp.]MCY4202043.1 hypothetical protein [Aestuariivita sp.]MCY4287456.1 hypothetical protein [Aestuariivita sp.]MCY4348016.1 hypothetical protein [Aestuariivita sp.]